MKASEFDFDLPEELIAQEPLSERTASRLLHLPASGPPMHRRFADLPDLLRPDDRLILNETRVIPARLRLHRETGGAVEALLVRPESAGRWTAMLRPAKRLHPGERLSGPDGERVVTIVSVGEGGEGVVEFDGASAEDVLARHGKIPLPPYVRREPTEEDRRRYQTVFARVPGAIAAPTAGLHFDEELLGRIREHGVAVDRIVLHVGPGTFRPLPEGDLEQHSLDAERFEVPDEVWNAVQETRATGGRVVAVGTTVVRALESRAAGLREESSLFIRPPYRFRVVDALVTNFHLPRSSLLCLVSALVGRERILDAYRDAVRQRYRFYSYGDATFLEGAACSV